MDNGTKLIVEFLTSILTGGGAYAVAKWLFGLADEYGVAIPPQQKRLYVLPICLIIAVAALAGEVALGVAQFTPDAVLLALTAAFTASQMFHTQDLPPVAEGK